MTIGTKTLSVFKLISLGLILLCFIMMFLPWITIHGGAFGFSTSESGNLFKVSGSGCFWTVMLMIFLILFFLAMALAVVGILKDRSLWVLPLAGLALLMFLFDMFTVFWTKGQMNSMMGGYGSYLSDYGVSVGVHMGAGAWLFLLFGLAAYGVLFFEDKTQGRDPFDRSQLDFSDLSLGGKSLSGLGSLGGWTCPNCGAKQGAAKNFCEKCGTKKPEPPRCPGCGKLVKPGEAFCSDCGTKL